MAILCRSCHETQVRIAGGQCSGCRARGGTPVDVIRPEDLAPLPPEFMEDSEPLQILETQLRHAREMQGRIQQVAESPRQLLCAACCEEPAQVENIAISKVLEWQNLNAKSLGIVVGQWFAMHKTAKKAAEQMDLTEMTELMFFWFSRLSLVQQRERLQNLQKHHNEKYGQKVG